MRKFTRILLGLLAIAGCHLWMGNVQAEDSSTSNKITLNGSYIWSNKNKAGKPFDLKAELTPDGPQHWKVVYNFPNAISKMPTTYTGTLSGDIKNGPVKGTAINENGKRTFTLQGNATNGVLTFTHAETTPNRVGPTGTGTLR